MVISLKRPILIASDSKKLSDVYAVYAAVYAAAFRDFYHFHMDRLFTVLSKVLSKVLTVGSAQVNT